MNNRKDNLIGCQKVMYYPNTPRRDRLFRLHLPGNKMSKTIVT